MYESIWLASSAEEQETAIRESLKDRDSAERNHNVQHILSHCRNGYRRSLLLRCDGIQKSGGLTPDMPHVYTAFTAGKDNYPMDPKEVFSILADALADEVDLINFWLEKLGGNQELKFTVPIRRKIGIGMIAEMPVNKGYRSCACSALHMVLVANDGSRYRDGACLPFVVADAYPALSRELAARVRRDCMAMGELTDPVPKSLKQAVLGSVGIPSVILQPQAAIV